MTDSLLIKIVVRFSLAKYIESATYVINFRLYFTHFQNLFYNLYSSIQFYKVSSYKLLYIFKELNTHQYVKCI